jgi:hypothetical protein
MSRTSTPKLRSTTKGAEYYTTKGAEYYTTKGAEYYITNYASATYYMEVPKC